MRTINAIRCLIIGIIFSSCENEIPYHPKERAPQLIMNAMLNTHETENYVHLSLSGMENVAPVNQAKVSLYVNGAFAENPEELPPPKPFTGLSKKYRITTTLHPGDKIRLEAEAESGKYQVSADVVIPHPVNAIQVDTCMVDLKKGNWWYTYRQFKVSLQDRANEKNHYRLEIRHEMTARGITYTGRDSLVHNNEYDIINREDWVLTDGDPQNENNNEDDLFGTYIENKYNVFTDSRFTNASYTLKVYTRLFDTFSSIHLEKVSSLKRTVSIRLLSISEAEYRYFKALNSLESDNYEETLMEPIVIPNNVKGGLGFVGASSEARITMQLPDIIFNQDESDILH